MASAGPIAAARRRSAARCASGAVPAGWPVNSWRSVRPSSSSASCSRPALMCCRPMWSRSSPACRTGFPASRSAWSRSCSARSWASAALRSSTLRWSPSAPPAWPRCTAPACAAAARWCSRCSGPAWSSSSGSTSRCCSRWRRRCSATPAGASAATGWASPRNVAVCCCASLISAWRPSMPPASASSSSTIPASVSRRWCGSFPPAACSASTTFPASRSPTAPP